MANITIDLDTEDEAFIEGVVDMIERVLDLTTVQYTVCSATKVVEQ